MRLRPLWLVALLTCGLVADPATAALAQGQIPRTPLYEGLLTDLNRILEDLERFDSLLEPSEPAAPATTSLPPLPAPPPRAIPSDATALTVRQRVPLSLEQALELAVRNDPALARSSLEVSRREALLRAAWSRFAPTLSLGMDGLASQNRTAENALVGNSALYAPSSPFYVPSGSWKTNLTSEWGGLVNLTGSYALLDFQRGPALDSASLRVEASRQDYADQLRQLQLQISESYYAIQLSQLRRRIREAEVFNDRAVRDQAQALLRNGLVPRVDLLRAEASLQQSQFRLAQVEADLLSDERELSNLVNVPFDVTLLATEPVRLQPPWPLDLPGTLAAGLRDNPQLLALEAVRSALIRQADAQAAALLPSLNVFLSAGVGQRTQLESDRQNTGCCGSAVIPEFSNSRYGYAAGLRLQWALLDGGLSRGLADASRAEASSYAQQQAEQRNGIRQRLERAFFSHQASLSQVIAARASLKAAREAFRDMRARYQLGLADYTDVSSTIVSLTRAMEDKAMAITTANLSYARMLRELLPVPNDPQQPVTLPITLPVELAVPAPGRDPAPPQPRSVP